MTEALSPFIEGTQIQMAWDSTSLGWLKTCPRLYQYSMIDKWRSKHNSIHLDFGIWYHSALEHYYKCRAAGADHETATEDTLLECLKWTWIDGKPFVSDHNLKTRENLVRTVLWYLDEFGDNDVTETVILDNGKPAVELSFRFDMGDFVLAGHLDRICNFQGQPYVMDHKTASTTIGSYYFDGYSPDNQMSLYSVAAKVIYNTPIKGIIIDAAQIAVGFSRFSRGFTFRTDAQLDEWLNDTRRWVRTARQYAEEGFWPMNDKACHHYGGCAFRKVCSKSPQVREQFLASDFVKKEWNPLESR